MDKKHIDILSGVAGKARLISLSGACLFEGKFGAKKGFNCSFFISGEADDRPEQAFLGEYEIPAFPPLKITNRDAP